MELSENSLIFFPTPFTGVIVFIKEEERPDGVSQTEQDGGIPRAGGSRGTRDGSSGPT